MDRFWYSFDRFSKIAASAHVVSKYAVDDVLENVGILETNCGDRRFVKCSCDRIFVLFRIRIYNVPKHHKILKFDMCWLKIRKIEANYDALVYFDCELNIYPVDNPDGNFQLCRKHTASIWIDTLRKVL